MSELSLMRRVVPSFFDGFVLAFHEIESQDLVRFVEHLGPDRVVHLSDLLQQSKRGKAAGLFAITVDDGIGENVRDLAAICRARGWPITFYIPTRYLDTGEPMPFQLWRRLAPLLPNRRLVLESGVMDLSLPGAVADWSRRMEQLWHTERLEAYLPMTQELADVVRRERGLTREELDLPRPITWDEVTELSRSELIRFESHGISHVAMSALTPEELLLEMRHSRDVITECTGRLCRHLAYPFGSPQSIGPHAQAMARRFYDSAVTMSIGHVSRKDHWMLPRLPLYTKNSVLVARLKMLYSLAAPKNQGWPALSSQPARMHQSAPAAKSAATSVADNVR